MTRAYGEKRFAAERPAASAQPIQRYHETGKAPLANPAGGYTPATSRAATPKFDFQSLRVNRLPDPTPAADPNVRHYQLEHVASREPAPALRVADANDLAVPARAGAEAKTFFATTAQIQGSNTLLHEAGAPLRLVRRNGRVTVPAHAAHPATQLSQVGVDLTRAALASSECGQFAHDLLGKQFSTGVVGGAATADVGATHRGTRDAATTAALAGRVPSAAGGNEHADPEVGEAFGIFTRPQAPPGRFERALALVQEKILGAGPYLRWGEHWAGVVARSGNDRVTMENYNRATSDSARIEEEVERDNKELRGLSNIGAYEQGTAAYAQAVANESRWARLQRLGRNASQYAVTVDRNVLNAPYAHERSYFQMYGPGTQSFHAQWQSVVPNAATFRMHGTDAALRTLLNAQLDALVPNDAYSAATAATLAAQKLIVAGTVGQAAIRAAYVAAARAVAVARLAAAAAHIRPSKSLAGKVRIDDAVQAATAEVNLASGDAIAKLTQHHINRMLTIR